MRLPLGLRRHTAAHVGCVAGLDLGPEVAQLIVLAGTPELGLALQCAEVVDVTEPLRLGTWLHEVLAKCPAPITALCVALDDAWVVRHTMHLPDGLGDQDLDFQVQAEVQALSPDTPLCVDHRASPVTRAANDETNTPERAYEALALPVQRLQDIQSMARVAGLPLHMVTCHSDAAERLQTPAGSALVKALGLVSTPHAVACGLALSVWDVSGFNLLPHRLWARQRQQRAWRWRMLVGVALGAGGMACVAATVWLLTMLGAPLPSADVLAEVDQAWRKARSAHHQASAEHQQVEQWRHWWQAQHDTQQATLRWHQALADVGDGLWLSQVHQQQTRWEVQGETLSPELAQAWVQQLAALPVWQRAPELQQLMQTRSGSASGWHVWQFRVVAELKAAGP